MKKILAIFILCFLMVPYLFASSNLTNFEKSILSFGENKCIDYKETDIPTIFIPGILASWYSEEIYDNKGIKKWVPDPITHSYDTLFKVFQDNGYTLYDVYYRSFDKTYIKGNPKGGFYLFGYDWKKDNKITAKILSNLIVDIRKEYEKQNGCDIGTVNIIGHSMGGLVVRSMLEDMCASDYDLVNYYKNTKKGTIKNIKSTSCNNFTKINNLITISTPHRGAPSSLPVWVQGDVGAKESFTVSSILKGQLGVTTDAGLYEVIHGYNDGIKNGIITIGQLLPDIGNSGVYNEKLLYLEKNGEKLSKTNHPQNSFLEELNKKENIERMFSNISGSFSLYYSDITGFKDKNNIIGYDIAEEHWTGLYLFDLPDKTEKYKGKDIYDFFQIVSNKSVYNIEENIRNDKGLGGDGTVPTNNLKLIENDSYNPKEFQNEKFDSIKINCYENDISEENTISKKLGTSDFDLCSHTKMPILTSIQIFEKISGKNILGSIVEYDERLKKERDLIYKYLGYVSHVNSYGKIDTTSADLLYKRNYNYFFETDKEGNRFDKMTDFIKNRDSKDFERLSLDFTLGISELVRYEIQSPINLIIEDEKGRKIGIDPETGLLINEIPGAWTSGDTEGSNEPEFFLIPKTGTGKLNHKITSYPTGEGEYHIVIQDFETQSGSLIQVGTNTIAGYAKEEIIEKYDIDILNGSINYKKDKEKLEEKYSELLEKIYKIIDEKYSDKQKEKLKNNLGKVIDSGNKNKKFSEKNLYLIGEVFNYLNK